MSSFHVCLNRLAVGPYTLEGQKISSSHQQILVSHLSRYLFSQKNVQGPASFRVKLNPESKEIKRIVQFYKNLGLLGKKAGVAEVGESSRLIEAMRKEAIPGTNGQILAGMRIAEDTLSLTRNILFSIPSVGPDDPIVNHLGYYAGIFWTFFAFRELDAGFEELKRSKLIGDKEGERRAMARVGSGAIVSSASLAYVGGRIFDTLNSPLLSAVSMGGANVLFGVGSCLAMGASLLGALRCYRFNSRLNEYLDYPGLPLADRFKGALTFLRDSICVTEDDKKKIVEAVEKEHPTISEEEKKGLVEQRIKYLIETKVKYMKRRTSNKSLQLILTQADRLIEMLSNESTQAQGIKETAVLLHTIQKENRTKMALYILGFVAALISFIAMIIGTFFSFGALPFVLYGIAGALYLIMGIYSSMAIFKQKEPEQKLDLHPLQDLSFHGA